jgi:hypothetical protein
MRNTPSQQPKLLIIDNQYDDPNETGSVGLSSVLHTLCSLDPLQLKVHTLQGGNAVKEFLTSHSLQDPYVFFIHDSFGMDWMEAQYTSRRESVVSLSQMLQERNPLNRIIIWGFASDIPVNTFIDEAHADAVWVPSTSQKDKDLLELITREVTQNEIRERGTTIEIACSRGRRVFSYRSLHSIERE